MRSTRACVLVSALFTVAVLSACGQPSSTSPGLPGGPGGDAPASASSRPAVPGTVTNRGTVTGRVVDAAGTPVAGVAVQPKSLDTPAKPIPELVVATDDKGVFNWTLQPGRYEFAVQPAGSAVSGRAAPQTTTVAIGQTVTVNFTLS